MIKFTAILIAFCLYFSDASACSCSGYGSYTTNASFAYNYLEGIIEFKVLSYSEHNIKVKIVKVWKGNYVENQELEIWRYVHTTSISSCGQPAIEISSFSLNERYIASLRKKGSRFDNTYDAGGQLFVPSNACGEAYLRVEQDSVKGATFGESSRSTTETSTLEYNMPYDEFNRRFALKLAIVLGAEAKELETGVDIFPNPAINKLFLKGIQGSIKIVDSYGKEVLLVEAKETVDVSSLKSGIYFLEGIFEDRKIRKKFIKE